MKTLLLSLALFSAWPAPLGTLDEVPKRFPKTEQSEAATKLVQLAAAAGVELKPGADMPKDRTELREALDQYMRAQLERSGDAIDAPPPAVAKYLADNAAALDAVRDHLLSGAKIEWARDLGAKNAPLPNLLGNLALQRILVVRALDKARSGDAAAWDELRASWQLNAPVWERPEMMSVLVAMAASRMSNAAARKMPLPVPDWFAATLTYDYTTAAVRAVQTEAWGKDAETEETLRMMAEEVVRSSACDVASLKFENARAKKGALEMPNLIGAWERLMRFRAEREATERVLQIRSGQTPKAESQCSDGSWTVTPASIKFTRTLEVRPPGIRVPLEYAR